MITKEGVSKKAVSTWNGSSYSLVLSNRFIYDGWNLLTELNATNNDVTQTYLLGAGFERFDARRGRRGSGCCRSMTPPEATALRRLMAMEMWVGWLQLRMGAYQPGMSMGLLEK